MIKVIAKLTINASKVEELRSNVEELIAQTRKEDGCIVYQLFQDINNQMIFTFVEEWESNEALQKHMNSEHFKEAMPKISKLQEKETEVNIYTLFA